MEGQYYHIDRTPEKIKGEYYSPQIEFDYAVRRYAEPNYKQTTTVFIKNIKIIFKDNWDTYFKNTFTIEISNTNGPDNYITEITIPNNSPIINIPTEITTNKLSPGYSESTITALDFFIIFKLKYKNGWYD